MKNIKKSIKKIPSIIEARISNYLDLPYEQRHDALLEKWVKEQIRRIPTGDSIIDLGAGEQKYRKYCAHLEYTSQDFCQYDGKGDGTGLQMGEWDVSKIDIISDIADVPVDDASFDAVLCTEVFEHIPDPVKALSEIYRILKPGGVLILTAPFLSETHFAPYHFCCGFDKYWYEYHLNGIGFDHFEISHYGNLYSNFMDSLSIVLSEMNWRDRLFGMFFRKKLVKYALGDNNSYEISCYGWNVYATK